MTITAGMTGLPDRCDLLVVGLGVTGAGVALDAAARGLDVVAVDAHDIAVGTSRWSSKLVHGGLRYLASLQLGIAHESAVERGILMETTAPHLTRTLPMVVPLTPEVSRRHEALVRAGMLGGDLLRRAARTSRRTLPAPRRISAVEALELTPGVRQAGLRGAVLSFDGQLEDDARLVVTIARTAAQLGASLHTRVRATRLDGRGAVLTGAAGEHRIEAGAVVNATGVWAGSLVPEVALRPSRGTHLVLGAACLPDLRAAVMAPVPGSRSRFCFVLPQPDGTRYVGLTDVAQAGPLPEVPEPTEEEVAFLLDVVGGVLDQPVERTDVVGAFAGLRPLLDAGGGATADLSRRHAVLTSPSGVVTVVGGKLTTYRRMAEDAVDAAVLTAPPSPTRRLPLLGAAPRDELARLDTSPRLLRRYGTEAERVVETAQARTGWSREEVLQPLADGVATVWAELIFGVTDEGAASVEDLLERRTRIALVPTDAARARPAAERVLELLRGGAPTS